MGQLLEWAPVHVFKVAGQNLMRLWQTWGFQMDLKIYVKWVAVSRITQVRQWVWVLRNYGSAEGLQGFLSNYPWGYWCCKILSVEGPQRHVLPHHYVSSSPIIKKGEAKYMIWCVFKLHRVAHPTWFAYNSSDFKFEVKWFCYWPFRSFLIMWNLAPRPPYSTAR